MNTFIQKSHKYIQNPLSWSAKRQTDKFVGINENISQAGGNSQVEA